MGEEMLPSTSQEKVASSIPLDPNKYKYLHINPEVDVVLNQESVPHQTLRVCLFCGYFGNVHVYHGHEEQKWFCKTAIMQLIGLDENSAEEFFKCQLFMCFACYEFAAEAITDYLALEERQMKLKRIQESIMGKINARPPGSVCSCFDLSLLDPSNTSTLLAPVAAVDVPTDYIRVKPAANIEEIVWKFKGSTLEDKKEDESGLVTSQESAPVPKRRPCPKYGKCFSHGEGLCKHLMGLENTQQAPEKSPEDNMDVDN